MKRTFLVVSALLLLTSCGGKSLAETACETYESGNLSSIVPAFAVLVREDPQYKPYLDASEKYVFHQQDLIANDEQNRSKSKYKVTYFRVPWGQYQEAKSTLDSFCAR